MSDERVIEYLRFRGQAHPPTDLVPRIMAAVDTAPVSRSPFAALLPAAVAVGAVAIVVTIALILGQDPNVGPGPTESTDAQPSPASVEELRAALESATEVLRDAPGVEGMGTSSVLGELSGATWFSWRPNGDQVVVTRTDVDVAETGWWLDPDGEPPARGENVTTTIHVFVGDESYVADADADAWVAGSREDAPPVVTIPTGILDREINVEDAFVGTAGGDVTVTRGPDGGTTWVLTAPYRDGTATSEWGIAPDGGLRTWSAELVGVTPTVEDAPFITSHHTDFTPLTDPAPIQPPDSDLPPDAAALGLPPDFPLEAGSRDSGAGAPAGPDAQAVQGDRCEHPSGVYRVDVPDGWWTNVTCTTTRSSASLPRASSSRPRRSTWPRRRATIRRPLASP